jgi:hypothetical protein
MWDLWSAESRWTPSQQFGNTTDASRKSPTGHVGIVAVLPMSLPPLLRHCHPATLAFCNTVARASPAIISRPNGTGWTVSGLFVPAR